MNIYDFFNSPDVAEYCQSIGHTLNAVECAVMINHSDKRTLEEKLEAYRTIIAEYPDMEIPEAFNHGHIKSFHKALEGVITFEEKLLEKFLSTEPGAIYQVEKDVFTSYEKALAEALEECFEISKKYLNNKAYISVNLSNTGKILNIGYRDDKNIFANFDTKSGYLLETFYIDIPVPFKAGDLVECNHGMGGVYVLKDIIRDNAEMHAKMLLTNDTSDMTAGIYYEDSGNIDCEIMHFYPDLRYCRRELEGEKRILKYVSLYEQKKLCLCGLLKVQKYLMLNERAKELKNDYGLREQLEQVRDELLL